MPALGGQSPDYDVQRLVHAVALALLLAGGLALCGKAHAAAACRTAHGRMALTNGIPSVRIWVIGTKRVLGVDQQDTTFDQLPANIRRVWASRGGARGHAVIGDFRVCALEPQRAGRMQAVRVASGSGLRLAY